jgi:hypothetical protein
MMKLAEQRMEWQAELEMNIQQLAGFMTEQPALVEMNSNEYKACIEPNNRSFCVSQPNGSILIAGGERQPDLESRS